MFLLCYSCQLIYTKSVLKEGLIMNKDYKELISDLTADVEHVNNRIKELDNITDKEDLPEDEMELIDRQEKIMKDYADVMMERIEMYKAKD